MSHKNSIILIYMKIESIIFAGRERENNQKGTGYLLQCVQRSGLGIFFVPLLVARDCVSFSFVLLYSS